MRQPLHSIYAPSAVQKRCERSRQESFRKRTSELETSAAPAGITITPLRGFLMALLFLGIPTVSLGTLCFSLLQNNLQLSQTNDELSIIASEVTAEVDSLGEEIDSLRERAGVPADSRSSLKRSNSDLSDLDSQPKARSASLALPVGLASNTSSIAGLSPRGGVENIADAFDLLRDAKKQVPELNQALSLAVKPALEETLAQEAAQPVGQPFVGKVEISSEFGVRSNPFGGKGYEVHEGIDFAGEQGNIIAAAGDGKVTQSGNNGGYGISVTIDHGYGYKTLYAHMSKNRVQVGDRIKQGQIIGYIGSTGRSSGPHLHYGLYLNDKAINPRTLLKLSEK
ncbi:MAG: M23 family metallopeptidase [Phormidesmis sp.]